MREDVRLVAAALLTVLVAACSTDRGGLPTYWRFENLTETAITVVWHRESGEQIELARVDPGKSVSVPAHEFGNSREVCVDGEIVVTGPAGEEVVRGPTNCNPWVVGASPSPQR